MSDISTDELDDQWAAAQEEGAERERKRIRQAQRKALKDVETFSGWSKERVEQAVRIIDAATRTKKGKAR